MGLLEVILTAIGLSMDALAVSVCKGLSMRKLNLKNAFIIALFFGGFQAAMPFVGYLLGTSFESYIKNFDHWIAFVLLAFIGGKMIFDTIRDDDDGCGDSCGLSDKLNYKELVVMAIATSIDALAVGIAMACLSDGMNIGAAVAIIGAITLVICFAGVIIGNKFGSKFEKNASYAGGVILILIGLKILLEHLGLLDVFFTWVSNIF
ncbi:MAG: manganese efflux pump [Ruminococcaceae bacterium]|nr:manganese efflux pump [Oscillospiraceae bacterium]